MCRLDIDYPVRLFIVRVRRDQRQERQNKTKEIRLQIQRNPSVDEEKNTLVFINNNESSSYRNGFTFSYTEPILRRSNE